MVSDGLAIGNHSNNHPNISASFVTRKTSLRWGHGGADQLAGQHGEKIINWNVDSLDWKGLSADEVYANIMNATKNGSIILQHSAGGDGEDLTGTVEALGRVIAKSKEKNMELVTVPDLIHLQ